MKASLPSPLMAVIEFIPSSISPFYAPSFHLLGRQSAGASRMNPKFLLLRFVAVFVDRIHIRFDDADDFRFAVHPSTAAMRWIPVAFGFPAFRQRHSRVLLFQIAVKVSRIRLSAVRLALLLVGHRASALLPPRAASSPLDRSLE